MNSLDLGIIGNCAISALIDPLGRIVWSCFSRLDGDPVFNYLLNDTPEGGVPNPARGGFFAIELVNQCEREQSYLQNSAVLCTILRDQEGNTIEIVDFCPRFPEFERLFKPPMIIRRITPRHGKPRICVRLRPAFEYGAVVPRITRGSNHIRYVSPAMALRLTTDAPISYIKEETPFFLDQTLTLIFGTDESFTADLAGKGREFLERTLKHWRRWTRSLSIPFEWQGAVIRAAITLKLCNFEETGAIVAALTTSIPEAPNSQRNWDYRFCWLRDAYFVIHALNRLGATETMEGFLGYINNIVGEVQEHALRPVYGITRPADLVERDAEHLQGYRGMGPVRIGNQAYTQIQNDVYGSVVLASTHAFFDRRLIWSGNKTLFEHLERLGTQAAVVYDQPDAGPWELRNDARVHTFSAVMCWAACDRLARIARTLDLSTREHHWRTLASQLHRTIVARAWNADLNSFTASFDSDTLDATLLLLHELDFLAADDPRFVATVEAIGKNLKRGDFLYRYIIADDFGEPQTAFTICTYWYIDALAALGRHEEARTLFETMLRCRNSLGLLSEDIDTHTRELWGNFPQTYSLVGLINSAVRLSRNWEEAF